tara:strand:- start:732 stop:1061 length:330 start_codon:yes stop_codon:yes gene_type:complete
MAELDLTVDSIVYDLVLLLSHNRLDNYYSWIKVALCLKNISPSLLPVFNEISQISKKWTSTCCKKHWDRIPPYHYGSRLGIGSLRYWAKKDNPEGYKALMDAKFPPLFI